MEQLTIGALCEIIRQHAPKEYNSIIIDTAVKPQKYDYCYIEAHTQKVEYKTERRSVAINEGLRQSLQAIIANDNHTYVKIDKSLVDDFNDAPKINDEGFITSTRKKMNELMNGGREVDHHQITLDTDNGCIAKKQPSFAVREECNIYDCPNCNGSGSIDSDDEQNGHTQVPCPECKGYGKIGTLTYFTPKVIDKTISLTLCLDGEIEGFPTSAIKARIDEKPVAKRMLTHFNGIDNEAFDDAIVPYIDIIRDKTTDNNALEDIYYNISTCYTFIYRNILTGKINTGVIVSPNSNPEIILLDEGKSKIFNRMKDSAKLVSRFLSNIGQGSARRNKEDLKRTVRLLIATVTADGIVSEEEKQSLTLAIRNIEELTSKEREELAALLSNENTEFLTDDDFHFNDKANADETLSRMQDIANSDGLVHETERELIEKLKLDANA